jgi:peptidyl-prolyl cis-trans isomerase C
MRKLAVIILLVAVAALRPARAADNTANPAASSSNSPGPSSMAAPAGDVVARVNGQDISRKELDMAVEAVVTRYSRGGRPIPEQQIPVLEHSILDDIISRDLVLAEGQQHLPPDLETKVSEQMNKMKAQMGGDEGLASALKQTGVTQDEYIHRMRENIIIQSDIENVVSSQVQVAAADIRAYYDNNRDKMKQPEMIRASHILIRCLPDASDDIKAAKRAQIEAVRALIKGGESFADEARKVSEDQGSAANGGDLGPFARGQMVPEFEEVAFSLKTNELSDVVQTKFGYHLILVTERIPAKDQSFDEVKADIEKFLKYQKSSVVARTHVKELRDKAKVEIFLKPLPPMASADGPGTGPARQTPQVETPPVAAPHP